MARKARQADLFTTMSDELYDDLSELTGQRIAHVAIWEESLADALSRTEVDLDEQETFDLDLYLADGIFLELYGVACYLDPTTAPIRGWDETGRLLLSLVNQGVWLDEIAVDEDDQLVLILSQRRQPVFYLVVGGWLVEEWDELPG